MLPCGSAPTRAWLDLTTVLLKHIRDNNADGSPLSDLTQVLPALSGSKVQALLNELREEGRVQVIGKRRWARWHLAASKAPNPAESL
jgi:ATP-dependent DNA helicase RecG